MQITVNETGAKTLKDARPMLIGGQNVYVTVSGGTASLMVMGRIVATKDAETMTCIEAQQWADEYRTAMNEQAEAENHMAAQGEADVATVIEALGGEYYSFANYRSAGNKGWGGDRVTFTADQIADRVRNALKLGCFVTHHGDGRVEIHNGAGSSYGNYRRS